MGVPISECSMWVVARHAYIDDPDRNGGEMQPGPTFNTSLSYTGKTIYW